MTWRDQLQKASFRNVPFEVESDDATIGRRVQVHEYPQRDLPYAEDLGRKARERSITAFVIGDDYLAKRDALLAAFEKAGSGELVHPYYGRMTVTVTDVRVSHTFTEGGMCRFRVSFVESGELNYPAAINSTATQSLTAADDLQSNCIADFAEGFSVDNLPEFAALDAVGDFNSALSIIESALSGANVLLSNPLAAFTSQLGDLAFNPLELATRFFGKFNKASGVFNSVSSLGDINARNLLNTLGLIRLTSQFNTSYSGGSTPTRIKIASNKTATQALIRQALIVQSAGMVASQPLPVYDDAIVLKTELISAIDNELTTANDTTYLTLKTLRTKTHNDVTARIQSAARLKNITTQSVTPALVLAYDLYEDATRDAEIVARNKIRHPGFIPVQNMKVLSA